MKVKPKAFICFSLVILLMFFQLPFSSYAEEKVSPNIKEVYVETAEILKSGDKVKFVAIAEGKSLQYEWYIYKNEEIIYVENYSINNYFEYTLDGIGLYRAEVKIKDEFSNTAIKSSEFLDVKDPVLMEIDSSYSNEAIDAEKTAKEKAEAFVNGRNFSSKTKYFIWTDTTKKMVYVFEGKAKEWKLIKTMSATVGKPSTPTIKGSFAINGRGPWLISENPNVRARYKVRIKGGYYFHSILVNPQGKIIDSRLGQALSHGCVRLSMENAKWMYDNIKDGTGVFIN